METKTTVLTAQQVAAMLHCDVRTVYLYVKEKNLPCSRPGGRVYLFLEDQVLAWLAAQTQEATDE